MKRPSLTTIWVKLRGWFKKPKIDKRKFEVYDHRFFTMPQKYFPDIKNKEHSPYKEVWLDLDKS